LRGLGLKVAQAPELADSVPDQS